MSGAKTIDYYFSFISLWSYIGSLAFADLVRRHGLRVNYKPIDLMAVFAASGGLPVAQRPPQRQAYRLIEMRRWQAIRDIPLTFHPTFYPANPSRGHRMLLAALHAGHDVAVFAHAGLRAVWADERDIEDVATLARLANESGLDGAALLAQSAAPSLVDEERALTDSAIARGLFGAPFYVYQNELFWGQDRLEMLDSVISKSLRARTIAVDSSTARRAII